MPKTKDPCKAYACKIQKCLNGNSIEYTNKFEYNFKLFIFLFNPIRSIWILNENAEKGFQEPDCSAVLQQMLDCCRKFKDRSLCCEGFDLNKEFDPENQKTVPSAGLSTFAIVPINFVIHFFFRILIWFARTGLSF